MEVEGSDFKIAILLSEAITLWSNNKNLTRVELSDKLLKDCNLSMKKIPDDPNDDLYRDYQAAKETVRNSFKTIIKKWRKNNYQYINCEPHDIFFDLSVSCLNSYDSLKRVIKILSYLQRDFESLIDYNVPGGSAKQANLSGESTASRKSWIEEQNPVHPKKLRKSFESLVPQSKRRQTDEIYWKVLLEAERLFIEPEILITYIGERYAR